jgi:hypothetical protein
MLFLQSQRNLKEFVMSGKISALGFLMLVGSFGLLQGQTIDDAIKHAAVEVSGKLPQGSTVAVINFISESTRLTDYVIDELNIAIVAAGQITPVERRRLAAIQDELNFNMSGEVSDESAQNIGRMLGAQNIVMGSIEIIGQVYRIRFQAVSAESASIQAAFSENIKKDSVLDSLLAGTKSLVDFSGGERLGTAGLNLLFGAGSFFIEGDKVGGGITALLEGLGALSFITSLILDNAYPEYNYKWGEDNYYGGRNGGRERVSIAETYFAYPFFVGAALYAGGAIYGVIRAAIYHRPGSLVAETPFDGLDINLVSVPGRAPAPGLRVAYTWEF